MQAGVGRLVRAHEVDAHLPAAGVDANLVRLVAVLGTIFGFGSFAIAYLVGWILMPEE